MTARVLLVTGGGRGIGAATARLAAARGYRVGVNYRQDRTAAEAVVADIERAGGVATAIAGDVAVEAEVVQLFDTLERRCGRLTALVNNAGILWLLSDEASYTTGAIVDVTGGR